MNSSSTEEGGQHAAPPPHDANAKPDAARVGDDGTPTVLTQPPPALLYAEPLDDSWLHHARNGLAQYNASARSHDDGVKLLSTLLLHGVVNRDRFNACARRDGYRADRIPDGWLPPALRSAVEWHAFKESTCDAATRSGGSTPPPPRLAAASASCSFVRWAVPSMVEAAIGLDTLFPSGRHALLDTSPVESDNSEHAPWLLSESGLRYVAMRATLTPQQCFSILSAAFLCGFSRVSYDCTDAALRMPSINFDEMHFESGVEPPADRGGDSAMASEHASVHVAKLQMFMDYFVAAAARYAAPSEHPQQNVTFVRVAVDEASVMDRLARADVAEAVLHPLGHSIDDQPAMLRADFANAYIGGGVLAYGCVQEEIMFSLFPQLCCARWMVPRLRDNEVLYMLGAEQFSTAAPGSYGFELRHGGTPPLQQREREGSAYIVALDALYFRNPATQYAASAVQRELVKATAAFGLRRLECADCWFPSSTAARQRIALPADVATGNWGCGAFRGDAEVKSILQWVACSIGGARMHYFPFDNAQVSKGLATVIGLVAARRQAGPVFCRDLLAAVNGATPSSTSTRWFDVLKARFAS